jgi:signal recognition particle subunit SRP54
MFDFLSKKFSNLFSNITGSKQLSADRVDTFLATVRDALLEADVPFDVANAFVAEVKTALVGKKLEGALKPDEFMMKVVHDALLSFLGGAATESAFIFNAPATIMMMGLQGSGKTTTIAKLARFIGESKYKVKKPRLLVASVDFYRPAAVDQLEILAQQVGVDFYRAQATSPIDAAKEIAAYRALHAYDILILDTAGRLHVDGAMLEELRALEAHVKPDHRFLVLDAMTGQESLRVAQAFDEAVGFTAGIITKLDSDARGGVAFSFRYALKKPVLFVGSGEKSSDLEPFRPERMVQRMLGMGDMLTLVEQANKKIKQHEQDRLSQSFAKDKLTLEDFAQHIEFMSKMGPLAQVFKYMPGAAQLNISTADLEKGELEMKKFGTILKSMTKKERLVPALIDTSRKARIAQGAGVEVEDIAMLLQRFAQSAQALKQFKRMGLFK